MKRTSIALLCALLGCGTCEREARDPAPTRAAATPAPASPSTPAPSRTQVTQPIPSPCNLLVDASTNEAQRRLALRESCISDSWPEATLSCFRQASTPAAEQACASTLDEARQDWLRFRVGKAESRSAGWACTQLEGVLNEAESCRRVAGVDVDPFPEMRRAMDDARATARTTQNDETQRSTELRCISLIRLAAGQVAALPCLGPRTP